MPTQLGEVVPRDRLDFVAGDPPPRVRPASVNRSIWFSGYDQADKEAGAHGCGETASAIA